MRSASVSQRSCSSMLQSTRDTHIWMCGGALTVFMMGEFGLENGPEQLFKWRFRLTLSCHKSRCLDASAAAKNCVCAGRLFVSRRGLVPGYLVLWELVRAVLPADTPALSRQLWRHHTGPRPRVLQQSCVRGASCLQVRAGWPLGRLHFFSYHCKKEHLTTPLFNRGGPSCSEASVNTITQNRNTSRLQ